jgi:histidine transport system permease protein
MKVCGSRTPLNTPTLQHSNTPTLQHSNTPTLQHSTMLQGYSGLIWQGALVTIELAVLSLVLAFILGLIGALAKLSTSRWLSIPATLYTTLIRGVPDLVLMFLLFYSVQSGLNNVTDFFKWPTFQIDPFAAGVGVLGFIYGAYFTETFRGAILSVPGGQAEAATAYGLTGWQTFSHIIFPQLMRFALPGISNNWQVILKATALVSIIGLHEVVAAAQSAIVGTAQKGLGSYYIFVFLAVAGLIYLGMTIISDMVFAYLNRKYSVGVRRSQT